MSISKEEIIELSQGGILFYKLFIPNLKVIGNRCKSTYNPFYKDGKPSFSIYLKNGKWLFMDHGAPDYHGDEFVFAGYVYGLNFLIQFPEILERMYDDLTKGIEQGIIIAAEPGTITVPVIEPDRNGTNKSFTLFERKFNKEELDYFGQYGITLEILQEHWVTPIDGYTAINSSGKFYTVNRSPDEFMFAFKGIKFAKIYVPKPKSFYWVGQKPDNYIFGWDQIEQGDGKHFVMDYVIITGGEKDVMTLRGLGYINVISLNSETASINEEFANSLNYHSFNRVAVLYDLDETGQKASRELADKFGFRQVVLPDSLKEAGGKDVSDYVALKLDIDQLKAIIQPAIDEDEGEPPGDEKEEEPPESSKGQDELKESQILSVAEDPDNPENPMPYFPEHIYEMLPDLLKESCALFDDRRQKDMYLLSALSVLSGCFPMIKGIYDDMETNCNVYSLIVAPPASGKAVMKWARKLGLKMHEYFWDEYKKVKAIIDQEEEKKAADSNYQMDLPKPVRMTLFIPADSSVAGMLHLMNKNFGNGIIFDTEADVVNRMFVTEWGHYSTVLRKSYSREPISVNRKGNNEYYEIENPVLSVSLSGTKDQLVNLVQEVDNGLFSRIIFYKFQRTPKWRDPWKRKGNIAEQFLIFSIRVLQMYVMMPPTINFELNPDQKSEFNTYFEQWTQEIIEEREGTGAEILFRIGLITFRISMLLSLLRKEGEFPEDVTELTINCDLQDFYVALELAKTLKVHSFEIYNELAGYPSKVLKFSRQIREYYHELPSIFTRKDADNIAEKMGIKLSTAEKWLEKFIAEKVIERMSFGQYSKGQPRKHK